MGWGNNYQGQLGANNVGQLIPTPVVVPKPDELKSVVKVVSKYLSSFAIDANGDLWGWGDNSLGVLGLGPTPVSTPTPTRIPGIRDVVDVGGGNYNTLALCRDGSLWSWGHPNNGALGLGSGISGNVYVPQRITGLPEMRAIACDGAFCLARDVSGNLWSWGTDREGELGLNLSGVTIQDSPVQIPTFGVVRQMDVS